MSKEKRRVPKLRFPGFTEDWEQRKLSEVTTCFDNLRVAVTASDRVPGKIPYYGANGIQDYVSGHTHSGEFVLIAEDGANDLNDYPIQYVNGAIWVNNHAHVIAGYKEKLENNFLSYSLKTVKMTTFIVGGGRSKLNLKALLEIPISMPNYDEQCVIGEFIETIDKNITLHQRKLNNLKLKKKALFQKLFPKNGERYPELRFPGFTDAWEQRKFGEIMTFLNGRAYKQDELLEDGKYKVLRVGNFYTNDSWYYSDLELDDKYYAMNGDLLYTWSATFGPHIWKGEKVIYHYHIWKLVLQDKIDKLFALQLLEVDKANIMSDKNGSTMVHITKQGMENKQTILPISLNEQKQIAKFLSSMDKLITLHQRKLDHLQLQKKALLQQMFV